MEIAERLAKCTRGFLIAPAGCGKTHLIADAVTRFNGGRELILTHTHAGVDVLRSRLRIMGAATNSYEIETIAGFALRYASAFPRTSGQVFSQPTTTEEWTQTYAACARVLQNVPIKQIVRASYSGLYVDEYQDCTVDQHTLICGLSEVLPCRVLGDPLQGIFDFQGQTLVDWERHVAAHFTRLPDLNEPWRWKKTAPRLGTWLRTMRSDLDNGRAIDLQQAPSPEVTWIRLPTDSAQTFLVQSEALKTLSQKYGTVVSILRWEAECNKFVNRLSYSYGNIETVACNDLIDAAKEFDTKRGLERVDAVVAFAAKCMTGISANLATALKTLHRGISFRSSGITRQAELELLRAVEGSTSLGPILPTLRGLRQMPKTQVWRRELYHEMCRALQEIAAGNYSDLQTAVWAVRNRTRHGGRRYPNRVVSRTVLVKGLEFDHCLILQADRLPRKDLYVALTRGSRTLTILSAQPVLNPLS